MATNDLIENIDNQIIRIRTKSLDVSFNELYDMYKNKELCITPDYQRLFRWNEEKQSRFIESLILEMPVPPIFVIEKEDGIYELIDGLQRISSYLHFRGELINNNENQITSESVKFELCGCDISTELNGYTFDSLPKALQIKLKRSFVRMEVIKKESDPTLKYHMFKRLNTGGELLSDQEIRNCTIRLLGDKGINFILNCSKNNNFQNTIKNLDTEKKQKQMAEELVLKFFAYKNDLINYKSPITDYLTDFLEKITINSNNEFDYIHEKEIFDKTFLHIDNILQDTAFSNYTQSGNIKHNFANYYFDSISLGISQYINEINDTHTEKIKKMINTLKQSSSFDNIKTGTVTSIQQRIKLIADGVKEIID